ncbi:4-hydroxyphenylpyruvate dioxygenase [Bosea sp. Leaf344]|uniref:4-hydroxyphenylpyruvate dioxygenase n=1 Tax=Bosea sp. Leaf344 TaxID=1736346 RepID=UPI0006F96D61|nr:4-hydroxyphenylpyruvate dioxygenase [Bosea sp. Leaf344]KQU52635.1 4-hydroxyphenylpyruvate dioxygenase [Bosea sp. Leaf344]
MGPFPHDAAPPAISDANPMGTDGFEFVEYAHPEPEKLGALFETMGFRPVARHRSKAVTLYRQGDVNFVVNAEPDSFAQAFAAEHGPCACAMAFRVVDAQKAFERAVSLGAEPYESRVGPGELHIPAVKGIGGSLLYFVDRYGEKGSIWDVDFDWLGERDPHPEQAGLYYLDHLTHNVMRGRMDHWADWYGKLFNFREIRFFNIEGKLTGLISRALTSPCGKIRIPINESLDDKSQIEEYLRQYKGEGIQHVALGARDIYASVERLRGNGLPFMPAPPETYYARVDARVPNHGEPVERLKQNGILIDGEGAVALGAKEGRMSKVLLQIFSGTVLGPIFFEFIQRKGDDGFGEGNFRALFESIEEDQIRRGVLSAAE